MKAFSEHAEIDVPDENEELEGQQQLHSSNLRRIQRGTTVVDIMSPKSKDTPSFNDQTIETLLNASSDMFIVVDISTMKVLAVNKAVEKRFNKDFSQIISLEEYFDTETLFQIAAGVREFKRVKLNLEGKDVYVEIDSNPIYWCGQNAVLLKVQEDKKMIEREKHEARIQTIEEITSIVIHEVNNALTTLNGNICMMATDPEIRRNYDINALKRAGFRTVELLERLSRFNKRNKLEIKEGDLHGYISSILKPYKIWELENNINVELVDSETPCICNFDQLSISQIIVNLLKNSAEAMPDGGNITIEIKSIDRKNPPNPKFKHKIRQDCVCITIEDNGAGIPEDNLERIFTKKFSTKCGTVSGFGIGLTVVKEAVESHGGQIFVESKTGKDSFTKFYIFIPKYI